MWVHLPNSVCLQGQGEGCWQPNTCLDGRPSVTSSVNTTALTCLKPESVTDTLTMHPSGTMCERLTESPGVDWWIALLRASRASHFHQGESGWVKMMSVTPGQTPFALLVKSGRDGSYWRIPQTSFGFHGNGAKNPTFTRSFQTWPGSGMWDGGAVFRLLPAEPHIYGAGYGLLPTPVKRDGLSFYVVTQEVALKRIQALKRGTAGTQIHWMQFSVVYHNLKKGWANPRFSEMMMGWPIGWTDLQPLGKDGFRRWQEKHGIIWA